MSGRKIGYARVAVADRAELNAQIERLTAAGCIDVFTDSGKAAGSPMSRPGFVRALEAVHSGDTLVVCSTSRLARSVEGISLVCDQLMGRSITLEVLDKPNELPSSKPSLARDAAFQLGRFLVQSSKLGITYRLPGR